MLPAVAALSPPRLLLVLAVVLSRGLAVAASGIGPYSLLEAGTPRSLNFLAWGVLDHDLGHDSAENTLTLPRDLSLAMDGSMRQAYIPELQKLRGAAPLCHAKGVAFPPPSNYAGAKVLPAKGLQLEISARIRWGAADRRAGPVPRTLSEPNEMHLHAFVDHSIVTLIAENQTALTVYVHPISAASTGVALFNSFDGAADSEAHGAGTSGREEAGSMVAEQISIWSVKSALVKTDDDSMQSDGYDCLLRRLALSYTQDVVLGARSGWQLGAHRDRALSLVAHGLRIEQCNSGSTASDGSPAAAAEPGPPRRGPAGVEALFVATTGSDSAAGTAEHPLASIKGAQAKIRAHYPTVSARPSVRVNIMPGDYFFGAAGPDHLSRSTQYSNTPMARFGAQDSGASPSKPIVYAATGPANFIGGLPLKSLAWGPAGAGFPPNAFKATVPGSVLLDVQDQLFLDRLPLVRARTPNGKPWIPLDGYNLSTIGLGGTLGGPPTYRQCTGHREAALPPPPPGNVTGNCSAINHGICLHNAKPILNQFNSVDPAECCKNCTALGSCVSWNINVKMKQCFLRGSYKPNSGAECISGCVRGACAPPPPPPPPRPPPPPTADTCTVAKVVCNASDKQQVTGVLGVSTASGRALASHNGAVAVAHCLQHALGLANDFPVWSAQSYGLLTPCDAPNCDAAGTNCSSCANAMYEEYNHPRWFGPWAKGIQFDPKQDTGAKAAGSFKFEDAAHVVVHAMAVGEWGGVQFRVASAAPSAGGRTDLVFSHGGYQQARGASFRHGSSRYYLEGDRQFLDVAGEWHFDPATHELFIIAPEEFGVATVAKLNAAEVLLTQTDTLFEFVGAASDSGSRVENVVLANLTFSHTSADFFRPHEETSGGDYTTHRSGAIKIENATGLGLKSNNFSWIGGNAIMLSASVRDVNVTANVFRFLGTSGVAVQGKTGNAMMDGRDGELMAAAHGPAADNGVRLPTRNLISNNIFADYGIWDKQSACYHKALAPGNMFKNNLCFNSSRHGVNFQDGFGGGGIAEGNVMFNLNRETSDTTAFNSWNRRNYITSSTDDPAVGVLVPAKLNEWRRNLILNRNYFGVRDSNGDGLRNDDGASNFLHSNNVLYRASITFNGGTQIHLRSNLLISGTSGEPNNTNYDRMAHWNLGPTPDVGSAFNNTFVGDSMFGCKSGVPCDGCRFFWQTRKKGQSPGIYTGDGNVQVFGSSDADGARWGICGQNLSAWRKHGQDAHSTSINGTAAGYTPERVVALAKAMLYAGQERDQRKLLKTTDAEAEYENLHVPPSANWHATIEGYIPALALISCIEGLTAPVSIFMPPIKTEDETSSVATIDNMKPRTDTNGNIVNAHQGRITSFRQSDGSWRWFWVGSAWVPCKENQNASNGCGNNNDAMAWGDCGFNNNNISVYSSATLSNEGWRLETNDALPRATRKAGQYWQSNFEYNPTTKKYVMWWIYSGVNTTVGVVQAATASSSAGPYFIVNPNVTLAHRGFTSAELFLDRDSMVLDGDAAPIDAYIVYSTPNPHGGQAAVVVELLDANWTSATGKASSLFGAGEGQVMLRWGSGSSVVYYVLQASIYGCCFCPQGSNVIVWTSASGPLGPFRSVGNINACQTRLCPGSDAGNGGLCLGAQGVPHCKGPAPAPTPPTPAPPRHTLAVGAIYGNAAAGEKLCLAANTSGSCVPHGHEVPSAAVCSVRLESCVAGSSEQQWRVTSAGELVSNITGACMDGAHGQAGQTVYTNFCLASQPAPIGQTWNVSKHGEIRNVASSTCMAFTEQAEIHVQIEKCGKSTTTNVWHFPSAKPANVDSSVAHARVWEVPAQQQGVTTGVLLASPIEGCDGSVFMWSGDAWQQAPDGRKEHDPQWWVPLCVDRTGGIRNLSAVARWNVAMLVDL